MARGLVLAAIAGGIALDAASLIGIAALFVLVVPFEKLFPRHDLLAGIVLFDLVIYWAHR